MESRQLRYFMRIVETGSMGHAAFDLNIGVSTPSQQIAYLRNELTIRLLQRTFRGITPTNADLAFYSQTQLALHHADNAIPATHEACPSDHASVDMVPSTASVLGVPFINAMRESYPDVRLYLVESLSGNLERMINTRQLDLAVVFQQGKILRWSAKLVLEKRLFLIGTYTLLAPLQEDRISPDQLTSLPLVMLSRGHGLHGRLEAVCRQHRLSVEVVVDADGLALLMQTMHSGLGATLQPGIAVSHLDHQALGVIDIVSPIFSHPNFLVSLSDDELIPAGLAARAILNRVMRQLVESDRWPGATLYVH